MVEREERPNGFKIEGQIDEANRQRLCAQLEMTSMLNQGGEVNVLITSHGGALDEVILVINEMERVRKVFGVKVNTIADGYVESGGAIIASLGDRRYAMPNTTFMIHDVQMADPMPKPLRIRREEDVFARKQQRFFERKMAQKMGKTIPEIRSLYDKYLNENQALKEGLIDEVIVYGTH